MHSVQVDMCEIHMEVRGQTKATCTLFFEASSLTGLEFCRYARMAGQWTQRYSYHWSPFDGFQVGTITPGFLKWVLRVKLKFSFLYSRHFTNCPPAHKHIFISSKWVCVPWKPRVRTNTTNSKPIPLWILTCHKSILLHCKSWVLSSYGKPAVPCSAGDLLVHL